MIIGSLRKLRRLTGMLWHLRRHLPAVLKRNRVIRKTAGARLIFVDLGAADGDSAELAIRLYPKLDRLILFEPSAERHEKLSARFAGDARVLAFRAAAGVAECPNARLYHEIPHKGRHFGGQGDSLIAAKDNVDPADYETVDVIDFSSFLLRETKESDIVILKVDIEGGEYDLLEHMLDNGSLSRVNMLFCEWHNNKVKLAAGRHAQLVAGLQRMGFAVTGHNRYDEFLLRRREIV